MTIVITPRTYSRTPPFPCSTLKKTIENPANSSNLTNRLQSFANFSLFLQQPLDSTINKNVYLNNRPQTQRNYQLLQVLAIGHPLLRTSPISRGHFVLTSKTKRRLPMHPHRLGKSRPHARIHAQRRSPQSHESLPSNRYRQNLWLRI